MIVTDKRENMIVTDKKWKSDSGEIRQGFRMDGFLAENLSRIPARLKKDWDVIAIVSGRDKVRIGKSFMAMQVAYFVAWLKAGGRMCLDREDPLYGKVIKLPTEEVRFGLDNICFDVDTLMKKGHEFPHSSVLVYDEGKEGLDSKSTMMSVNRTMDQFLQQCGVYNHFLIIVLPDFFSLNKSFATARSNFLIDVFHDDEHRRGLFNFFDEPKKERLYVFGRKLLGNFARYSATEPTSFGNFPNWMPFDKKVYDDLKRKALSKVRLGKRDLNIARQRDIVLYLYKNLKNKSSKELEAEIFDEFGIKIGSSVIRKSIEHALMAKEKKLLIDEQKMNEEE